MAAGTAGRVMTTAAAVLLIVACHALVALLCVVAAGLYAWKLEGGES